MTISTAELDELKSRPGNDCETVASKWVRLRKSGGRILGPCPLCSQNQQSKKATKFEVKDYGLAWTCAGCSDGGDVLKLVMLHEDLDFRSAVEWLGGSRQVDPEKEAKRAKERAEKKAAADAASDLYRQRERRTLYGVWNHAIALPGSPAEGYLRLRGIDLPSYAALRLRCVLDMPYFHGTETGEDGRKRQRVVHRGPAMVAPIIGNDGKFRGLHFTHLDLTRPNGKVLILDPETGEELPAKKVRGSKSAGHIDIVGSRTPTQIIIGEGIEKTIAIYCAGVAHSVDFSQTAFWTSVDLGNMGGLAKETVAHPILATPTGKVQRVPGPDPDLSQPGIEIPSTVTEVIQLGDSTSDRITTHCALYRGAQRWLAVNERVTVRLGWAPEGMDFDDILRRAGHRDDPR